MGVLSNKISRDTLKPGDHIYTWRSAYLYSHHGIYEGGGKVIHFTRGVGQEVGTGTVLDRVIFSSSASPDQSRPQCIVCGDLSNKSGVISSCLDCFLWGGDLYVFEYGVSKAFFLAKVRGGTCTLAPSDSPTFALYRATCLLENGFGVYNTFKNNCEDFAIYCKTGLLVLPNISAGQSGQALTFVSAIKAIASPPSLRFLTTTSCTCSGLVAVGFVVYCGSRLASDIGFRRDVIKVPVAWIVDQCRLNESDESVLDQCGPVESLVNRRGLEEPAKSVDDQFDSDKMIQTTTSKED